MPDNIPQWPFIPAIQGQVPTPRPDPRQDKSLAFAKALMATKAAPPPVPMPKPDPRDWTSRAVMPQMQNEDNSQGAIHPDALMQSRGGGAFSPPPNIDNNTYTQPDINKIIRNNVAGSQRPFGEPDPGFQRGAGLFGVPQQNLQQMAAAKPPDQNLPKIPQSGFVPSLSPFYMNDKGLGAPPAPGLPPIFWQPG